jgi:NAD(P)-dependent dehydrogenase (short-subunit alcohol dehydrogenase family)
MKKLKLLGKIAIVTGASSGIGKATALALAREGACVALAARRSELLEEVAAQVEALGPKAITVRTDVTQDADIDCLVERTLERWGRIDILFSNAGQYIRAPLDELELSDLQRSMEVNFYGHARPILKVLPLMRKQGSGHIVLMSTVDAKKPVPPDIPYVAAKMALSGFGDLLRQELHGSGIDVTVVFPGRVDTDMIDYLDVPGISAKISAEAVARASVDAIIKRQAEVILPAQARLLYYVNVFAPRLADWGVRFFKLQGEGDDNRRRD